MNKEQQYYGDICTPCAKSKDWIFPEGSQCTWWIGECGVCKKKVACCHSRDWAKPKPSKEKKCPKCNLILPKADFGKDKKNKDGLFYCCRACKNKLNRKYYKKNKE